MPFSKGLLATTLTATGLPPERAFGVAMDVEWQLLQGLDQEVSVERLRQMVELVLAESEGSAICGATGRGTGWRGKTGR